MGMSRRELIRAGLAGGLAALAAGDELKSLAAEKARRSPGEQGEGRQREMDARPGPVEFNAACTAVLVIDMQNDFGSKGGMFDRAGIDISGIRKAIEPTAKVLAAARAAGIPIVYLKMGYRPDLSDLGSPDSVNRVRHLRLNVGKAVRSPDGRESRILVRDTWNTDIVLDLASQPGDQVLYKTRFSGFYQTDLDARLRRMGVRHLMITGCTTSICVDSTVRDAMFRDYLCVLLADCMSEPIGDGLPRSNHDATLLSTEVLLGWVSTSAELIKALQASH